MRCFRHLHLILLVLFLFGCSSPAPEPTTPVILATPTPNPIFENDVEISLDVPELEGSVIVPVASGSQLPDGVTVAIQVDALAETHEISPYIYGVSAATADYLADLRPTVNSWGGNTATRYNFKLGNAWNAGSDWNYRNGNFYEREGDASAEFLQQAADNGVAVRFALPTLGWVAKDNLSSTCSFPNEDGTCGDGQRSSCTNKRQQPDPTLANVPVSVTEVQDWVRQMMTDGREIKFFAMDNEPGLWGITHYDVHPECTTYAEILDKYLTYAAAVREVAPDVELTGPVTCCWSFYWDSPAGITDKRLHEDKDFLPWFLQEVRKHDESTGIKTIDVLDIHFYPESVYNDKTDERTSAVRLRSTRSLWDWKYSDESWISTPIALIPRMQQVIEQNYPGLEFGISEWNFGADETMNGALAVADALGIFGREDLYFANYWLAPAKDTAGYNAFKLFTNYNGQGSRFGDLSVETVSSRDDKVSGYSAFSSTTGQLHIVLVNKLLDGAETINVNLGEFGVASSAVMYQIDQTATMIQETAVNDVSPNMLISLPPYSVTHLVLTPTNEQVSAPEPKQVTYSKN